MAGTEQAIPRNLGINLQRLDRAAPSAHLRAHCKAYAAWSKADTKYFNTLCLPARALPIVLSPNAQRHTLPVIDSFR